MILQASLGFGFILLTCETLVFNSTRNTLLITLHSWAIIQIKHTFISGRLKELIQAELDIPASKQVLRGWLNSRQDGEIDDKVSVKPVDLIGSSMEANGKQSNSHLTHSSGQKVFFPCEKTIDSLTRFVPQSDG